MSIKAKKCIRALLFGAGVFFVLVMLLLVALAVLYVDIYPPLFSTLAELFANRGMSFIVAVYIGLVVTFILGIVCFWLYGRIKVKPWE